MKYIINSQAIVFFHNGKQVKVAKGSANYARILQAFDLPIQDQEKAINDILNNSVIVTPANGFEFKNGVVFYKGEELPTALSKKILSISQEGLPVSIFEKFWENLQQNPSSSSVRELYDFLAYKELPITEDGCFLAYKGVNSDFWSISGNVKTKVAKGKVDSAGRIYNGINEEIEVRRFDVDDNRNNHCSFGLHVGSLDYAKDFGRGKLLVVKVNPKDVVSVPTDCNCQKCRVSKYTVVAEFEQEITAAVTDEKAVPVESQECKAESALVARVKKYLAKKAEQGLESVSIQSVQNSFSPDYPSRTRILNAVSDAGYLWTKDSSGAISVIL